MGSPVAISRASSESHGKRSPISGPSPLYPWLKSEPKIPDLDSEKSKDHSKRGFQTKSPPRPSNFSIQSLASERAEIRPSPLGDSTRTHSSREHRSCETRSFLDNPLVPSLGSLDKRPIDYRPSAGSIDLNRNSLYGRFDPMPTLYPHHVTPMAPHISGYPYPSSSFLTDYHSAPRHPMVLGTRDPMTSLVRTSDAPFFIMHDFDDRLGGRHWSRILRSVVCEFVIQRLQGHSRCNWYVAVYSFIMSQLDVNLKILVWKYANHIINIVV
jgi:hypothetical protein